MRKKIEWVWEQLDERTQRAKVIGGWVLRTIDFDSKLKLLSCSTVFIADRDHEWHIMPPVQAQVAVASIKKSLDFDPSN